MFPRTTLVTRLSVGLLFSATLLAQDKPSSAPSGVREFPMVLQQSVSAGKTPVGTKIQAKLLVATLGEKTVFPRNAVFSGEVTESVAKTATAPSRLGIRMDSVQWKQGSAVIKVYLTAWYYPSIIENGQNLQYGPALPPTQTWNGQGGYPDPNSQVVEPFPGRDSDKSGDGVPNTSTTVTSRHRVLMKNVQSARASDGAIVIASIRSDIKLDKLTTYVFAESELQPAKWAQHLALN